jgi:Ca2+-binding EF-hand superfamily protein
MKGKKKQQDSLDEATLAELEMAFRLYDDKATGYLNGREIKSIIRGLGFEIKKPKVRELLKTVNREYEEKVSKAEFLEVMEGFLPPRHSKEYC